MANEIKCVKCGSKEISIEKQRKNVQRHMVYSWNGLGGSKGQEYRIKSYDTILLCECQNCSEKFEKQGDSYKDTLGRGEWN